MKAYRASKVITLAFFFLISISISEKTLHVIMEGYSIPSRTADGCIPTLNNKGFQFASTSPLLDEWLQSFDRKYPLLDLGCAYGINTCRALESDIPTIALDMENKHLEILKLNVDPRKSHLLSCVVGSLPHDIPIPDCSVSAILSTEVITFLKGPDINSALATMFRKLVPGGFLFLTAVSMYHLEGIDDDRLNHFLVDLAHGVKWPGLITDIEDVESKLSKKASHLGGDFDFKSVRPPFIHFFVPEQLEEQVSNVGFEIRRVAESQHPGYPLAIRNNPRACIQVVAMKPYKES